MSYRHILTSGISGWRHAMAIGSLGFLGMAAQAQGQAAAPAGSLHVGFAQAIDMAVTASPKRAQAQADVDIETAHRREALAGIGPKLSASYGDTRYDKDMIVPFGADSFLIRPNQLQEGSITLSQPLTGIYTSYLRAGMARTQKDNSVLSLDMAKTDAAFEAADAYRRAQAADELVRIADASILATNSQVHDAEALVKSGRLIRSDLLKLNIAQQDARTQMAKAVATQKKAHERLRYAMGVSPTQALTLEPMPKAAEIQSFKAPPVDSAINSAATARLDLKQSALGVEHAEYAQRLARWKYAPEVDLFLKWDRIYSLPPFGVPEFTRAYGLSATWELWDNGARVFGGQAAAAQVEKANIGLKEVKDHLRLEIQGLLADLEAAEQSLDAAKVSVAQAEEAYRLDKARFASGLVTTTDLLLSEAGQTKARGALVTATTDVNLLVMGLQRTMGETRPQ